MLWFSLSGPAMADTVIPCAGEVSKSAISDCSRLIDSGLFDPDSVRRAHIRRGIAFLEAGDLDNALADFSWVIERTSNNSEAFHYRGRVLGLKAEYDQAVSDLTKALELGPRNALHPMRRLAQMTRNREEKDVDGVDDTPTKNPLATIHISRAEIYEKTAQFRLALKDLSDAIAIAPDNAEAHRRRGAIYLETGRINQAIADLSKAIELDPDNPLAYQNRGAAYARRRRYHRAFSDFGTAIVLDPTLAEAYRGRGTIYGIHGQHPQALTDFSKMVALAPNDASAHHLRGTAFMATKRMEEAIAEFETALECDPSLAQAHQSLGIAFVECGNHARAIDSFTRAIELDGKLIEAYRRRSEAYRALGRETEADDDLRRAEVETVGGTERIESIEEAHKKQQAESQIEQLSEHRAKEPSGPSKPAAKSADVEAVISVIPAREDLVRTQEPRDKQAEIERLTREGMLAQAEGRHGDAIALLNQVIKLEPARAGSYHARGLALAAEGWIEEAIADYGRAIELNPANTTFYIDRARAYEMVGRAHDALSDLGAAIKIDNDADARFARGQIHAGLENHAAAWSDFDAVIRARSDFPGGHLARGIAAAHIERHEEAILDLTHALTEQSESRDERLSAYFHRAGAYHALGRHDEAILNYDNVVALSNNHMAALLGRAASREAQGDLERAIDDYSKAISFEPLNAEAIYGRATAFTHMEDYPRALKDFDRALDLNDQFAEAYQGRAYIHALDQRYDLAKSDYTRALTLKPDDADCHFSRGCIFAELGETERALADYQRSIELNPEDVGAYFNRALLLETAEELDEALIDFRKVVALDPENADAHERIGSVLCEQDKFVEALRAFETALSLDPGNLELKQRRSHCQRVIAGTMQQGENAPAKLRKEVSRSPLEIELPESEPPRESGRVSVSAPEPAPSVDSVETEPATDVAGKAQGPERTIPPESEIQDVAVKSAAVPEHDAGAGERVVEQASDTVATDVVAVSDHSPDFGEETNGTSKSVPDSPTPKREGDELAVALADADRAVKKNPKDARVYALRGFVHIRRGEWERALGDFRKSFSIDPELEAAHQGFERLGVRPWIAGSPHFQ